MKFLLQTNNGEIDEVEVFNARNLIQNSRGLHEYLLMDYSKLKETKEYFGDWIPIGTLEYVGEWLKKYKGIESMNPIEVPEILREEKYLGRSYDIVSFEDLELKGYKFIKDIDKLKQFSFTGDLGNLDKNDSIFISQNYLISNVVDIMSEYRVFVSDMSIKAIQFYDGDCTVFPNISLLREMIGKYYLVQDRPKSYTMDIAVLKNGRTIILEVHPVVSVGTYGYSSSELLNMYKNGIEYYCKTTK
jgi:hypothetical protein